jgi:hypothetical protein
LKKNFLNLLWIAGACLVLASTTFAQQTAPSPNPSPSPTPILPPPPTAVLFAALQRCPADLPMVPTYTALMRTNLNRAALDAAMEQCFAKNAVRHLAKMRAAGKAGNAEDRMLQALLFDESAEGAGVPIMRYRITNEEKTFVECVSRVAQSDGLRAAERQAIALMKTRRRPAAASFRPKIP